MTVRSLYAAACFRRARRRPRSAPSQSPAAGEGSRISRTRYTYPALNGFDRLAARDGLAASEVLSAIAETEHADDSTRRSIRTCD